MESSFGEKESDEKERTTITETIDEADETKGKEEEENIKPPSEEDYETIKLISNGAYG